MFLNFKWYSHSGSITEDNRDFCGIKFGQDYNSYLIVDGTTCSPNSGEFAQKLVEKLFESETPPPTKDALIQSLKLIHRNLRLNYLADSVSFLLVQLYPNGQLTTFHSGDCLVGKHNNGKQIEWLISPHTLANATKSKCPQDLANDPHRHSLTRSFRGRRFIEPEFNTTKIALSDQLLLASDGFWAELSTKAQAELIQTGCPPANAFDDISYLLLNLPISNLITAENNSDNLLFFEERKHGKEKSRN